jgi:hypothetical protein
LTEPAAAPWKVGDPDPTTEAEDAYDDDHGNPEGGRFSPEGGWL